MESGKKRRKCGVLFSFFSFVGNWGKEGRRGRESGKIGRGSTGWEERGGKGERG